MKDSKIRYSNCEVFVKERGKIEELTKWDKRRWKKGRTGPTSKQAGKAGEAVRNKRSGSHDRVGSAMAHLQGLVHIPIEAHTPASALTHRAAVGDTGVQKVSRNWGP